MNSIEGPELALFRRMLFSAMQKTRSSNRCKKTGTNSLGPGSYRFRLVASNSEGLWNGPETAITLNVAPA